MFPISVNNNFPVFLQISRFQEFELLTLEEKDLNLFFENNDVLKSKRNAEIKGLTTSKSTDFIHFIWMGNPIKDSDEETILSWKKSYPSQQIILWVDKKALESDKIIQFAIKHNIKLIDLEEIFINHHDYTFGLSEFIKVEKNRLPPNWGAISDIYRYLIMYYFGGTYSDTDSKINYDDTRLDFDMDIAFYKLNTRIFPNDRIMTKNIRQNFWLTVFVEIKKRYHSEYNFKFSLKSRRNSTIERSGPFLLLECIYQHIDFNKTKIQSLDYKSYCNYSWKATLSDEKCEKLSKEEDIVTRIVSNIMIDLKETKSLNLQKYDNILAKIPKIERECILHLVEIELEKLDKKNITVQNVFAKNPQEYEKFLNILEKRGLVNVSCLDKKNIFQAFKKAAKRKNIEMFKYLFNKYPNALFPVDAKMIKLILGLDNKEIFLSVLNYARENNQKMDFYNYSTSCLYLYIDLDLALDFFKQIQRHAPHFLQDYSTYLPKSVHSILFGVFCPKNEDKLDEFEELLNIVPLEMLTQKVDNKINVMNAILSNNFLEVIPLIYTITMKNIQLFWNELISSLDPTQNAKIKEVIQNANLQPLLSV